MVSVLQRRLSTHPHLAMHAKTAQPHLKLLQLHSPCTPFAIGGASMRTLLRCCCWCCGGCVACPPLAAPLRPMGGSSRRVVQSLSSGGKGARPLAVGRRPPVCTDSHQWLGLFGLQVSIAGQPSCWPILVQMQVIIETNTPNAGGSSQDSPSGDYYRKREATTMTSQRPS